MCSVSDCVCVFVCVSAHVCVSVHGSAGVHRDQTSSCEPVGMLRTELWSAERATPVFSLSPSLQPGSLRHG